MQKHEMPIRVSCYVVSFTSKLRITYIVEYGNAKCMLVNADEGQ